MAKDRVIVGVDIGSSKITTLIASLSGEDTINIIGVSTVVSRGLRKGQIVDIEESVAAITESLEGAERMAGVSVGNALVGVGGAHIACQNSHGVVAVSQPEKEITSEDVTRVIDAAKAVSLPSSREIIHVIPRGYIVDSQEGIKDPLGMTGIRLEVETHIITGSTTAMRNLAKCVSEVGVDVDSLVYNGLASSYAILTDTEKELGVVSIDIGGGTTDICIYVDGALAHSAVLPVGARNITNDLAIGLRMSLESAEKIKLLLAQKPKYPIKEGEESESPRGKEPDDMSISDLCLPEEIKTVSRKTLIEGIIKPRMNEIFAMIGLEIKKSGLGGLTPSGIVITGGGAETVGILEACKRTLAMPVRIGIPRGVTGLTDEIENPSFATAVGLILYGVKEVGESEAKHVMPQMGKFLERIPVKGAAIKIIDLVKSFLP
jgi:cell division protein FtsA